MPDLTQILHKNKAKQIIIEKEIKADRTKEVAKTWAELEHQISEQQQDLQWKRSEQELEYNDILDKVKSNEHALSIQQQIHRKEME